ncbi:hypothetical protein QBC47DRAFT_402035 [Echria macrotheca]|uniref:RNA polymerase II degradation factor 1 n=1 Tax=Echria macrotheca TaxID=438768 RepID=A0AAJ0BHB8_9PEZI|nr:hypothetical protein QBC47DRAFT_402035 [Echria macrotheca]
MSEVQTRPVASRGRGTGRGGRGGGHSTRGGSRIANRTPTTNGDSKHDTDSALPTLDDEGEVGQLKKLYGTKVGVIKEIVPDWSDVDILFALRETDGDENLAVSRIAEGTIAQWGEVSKPKKERIRPKEKNDRFTTTTADSAPAGGARHGRGGRGLESGRGGRGRATERGGRGGARGKSTVATPGTRAKETSQLSVPTEEASEWKSVDEEPTVTPEAPVETAPAPVAPPKPVENAPKTWASMLRQSTTPKPTPKPKEGPTPKPAEPTIEPLPPAETTPAEPEAPAAEEQTPEPEEETVTPPAPEQNTVVVPEIALPPSKDQLTETNLEQIADESHPAPTGTARSEATDSWDPRAQAPSATATPLSASQQQHQPRAPTSGYAATATKATERAANRTPSHSRRILEQREAVRMPGNRDQVDRAAVQFGAFSLNGPIDDDIDGDREEPETRVQPPEDSPVAHPRTSLPPPQPAPVPEAFPAQKPAASLPPTGPAAAVPTAPQAAPSAPPQAVQPPTAPSAQQYTRFGQPAPPEPSSFPASKPFDSFAQQPPSAPAGQSQFEAGPFASQAQSAQAQLPQQPGGAFSSAPSEYSSFYTADPQGRTAYNAYYNQGFGQQHGAQGQQEGLASQPQRSFSGYNVPQNDIPNQYPQSGAQGRFGPTTAADTPATANPTPSQTGAQGQTGQVAQGQSHGAHQSQEFYGSQQHPYYNSPYYSGYMGGFQGGYSGSYGGPYGKAGLGYQSSQFGITPQAPHGYGSSPGGGFGASSIHRDAAIGAGLGDYNRSASNQSGQGQGLGSSGFGGMHDAFSRNASGYPSQGGQSFNAPGPQPGSGPAASDDLKPFGDAKAPSGPSPSLGAAARPGSAANNGPSQAGLPPQSSQPGGLSGIGGYGAYPGPLQGQQGLHGNQTAAGGYGMSASGGQGHQSGYGAAGYGQGFGYYGNQQPRGGWGNNYHQTH